jgi:uncharacterized Tic20 family protein
MIMEVASSPLHFLVGTVLSTMTATVVCKTCTTPALLVMFAPLIGVVLASLVGIASSVLFSGMMRLIVYVMALVKIDLPAARSLIGDNFRWWMPMERVYASR